MTKKELAELQAILDIGNAQLRHTFALMSEMHEKMVATQAVALQKLVDEDKEDG